MWFLLILWVIVVLAGLNMVRHAVRVSAGFLWIALYGVFGGVMRFVPDERGQLREVVFSRKRRIRNAIAAVVVPVVVTALAMWLVVNAASMIAQITIAQAR